MKRNILVSVLCLTVVSGLLLVSCDKDTNVLSGPTLTLSSPVTAAPEGGSYSFTYTVDNPVSGATVSCTWDVSWLSDFNTSVDGTVSFTVAETKEETLRSGNITLIYTYSGGYVSKQFAVVQRGRLTPVFSVQPLAVTASVGGGSYIFSYSVENASDDGEVSCSADVDWISDFDCSDYGVVGFSVAGNESSDTRTGVITCTYTCGEGAFSGTVTVVQDNVGLAFNGTIASLVGTYEAYGAAYDSSVKTVVETTWTLKMFADEDDPTSIIIDGLVPLTAGYYPEVEAYIARGSILLGHLAVFPQATGYYTVSSSGLVGYYGYTPCTGQNSSGGFLYDTTGGTILAFEYDEDSMIWSANYGEFFAVFSDYTSLTTIYGFLDVVVPTPAFTLTKISSSTDVTVSTSAVRSLDEAPLFTDFASE